MSITYIVEVQTELGFRSYYMGSDLERVKTYVGDVMLHPATIGVRVLRETIRDEIETVVVSDYKRA